MNPTQINQLSIAIANLIAAFATVQPAKTPSLIESAPKAPTHAHAPASATPVTPVTPVKAVKPAAEALKLTPAGLIDVTKLAGLVKARAVAANNRTIAAAKKKA